MNWGPGSTMERTELPTKARLAELAEQGVRPQSPVMLRALATAALCAGFALCVSQVNAVFASLGEPLPYETLAERIFWAVLTPTLLVLGAGTLGAMALARMTPRFISLAPTFGRVALRWPSGSALTEVQTLLLSLCSAALAVLLFRRDTIALLVRPLEQWLATAHTLLDRAMVILGVVAAVVTLVAGATSWLLFRWQHRMTRAEVLQSEE